MHTLALVFATALAAPKPGAHKTLRVAGATKAQGASHLEVKAASTAGNPCGEFGCCPDGRTPKAGPAYKCIGAGGSSGNAAAMGVAAALALVMM